VKIRPINIAEVELRVQYNATCVEEGWNTQQYSSLCNWYRWCWTYTEEGWNTLQYSFVM